MDSMRSLNTSLPASSAAAARSQQAGGSDAELLNDFKAAALNVTKLYKTAAAIQTKARQDGYQECLDELLAFLDREHIGLGDGEGWRIRGWATERLKDDGTTQTGESDDENDKPEAAPSPELIRSTSSVNIQSHRSESVPAATRMETPPTTTRMETSSPTITPMADDSAPADIRVPTREHFTFSTLLPYPQQDSSSNLDMESLDLSDRKIQDSSANSITPASTSLPAQGSSSILPRSQRMRLSGNGRNTSRQSSSLGRGAGSKRKLNYGELFGLGNLLHEKEIFGNNSSKRNRHT